MGESVKASSIFLKFHRFNEKFRNKQKCKNDALTHSCHKYDAIVKIIFEADYINRKEDIIKLCRICAKAVTLNFYLKQL